MTVNTSKTKNKILIIAPHQDDEVIGCGGSISLFSDLGYEVFVVHVFSGSSNVAGKEDKLASFVRHKESEDAAKILKFKLLDNLGFEDRKEIDTTKIQNSLISVIRKVNPSVVFMPHSNEQDFEHQIVNKATWEAGWLAATDNFKELGKKASKISAILGYEVWTPIQRPDFYLDITKHISKKEKALKKFPSQVKDTSWVKGSIGLNSYRGTMLIGSGYAEAFEVRSSNLISFIKVFGNLMKGNNEKRHK